ncbi:Pantothenate kinase 4 [Portunus trituberculatus]|uniref:Pantothenate kinase 4 n=1 Tax=Portunus trituberculatus TaxID=210409 RepID=A0A5B7FRX9_PORTR|nr:Pantothenate kinase 4 [Portunus trituberculatus]
MPRAKLVEADDKYERIGGTSMGGGTFWGLGSLLTKAKGFDELLQLASEGDHRNVDLLVKDIYEFSGSHCAYAVQACKVVAKRLFLPHDKFYVSQLRLLSSASNEMTPYNLALQ